MNAAVIVNPAAGRGRAARRWPPMARLLEARIGGFPVRFTRYPGEATAIAREFLSAGYDAVLAAGGDGTLNEVLNGFFDGERPVREEACLGILPAGSAGDFARSLGIPRAPERAVEVIAAGAATAIDVGVCRFAADDGATRRRYFLNVASFGLGGEVARGGSRRKLGYLGFVLARLLRHRGAAVRIEVDGGISEHRVTHVAIGNGRFHGGGVHICPGASLDDGVLEVTLVEELGALELLRNVPVLYSGAIYGHPKVKHLRGDQIAADSAEVVLLEMDGESIGRLPLEAGLLRKSVRVLGAMPLPR